MSDDDPAYVICMLVTEAIHVGLGWGILSCCDCGLPIWHDPNFQPPIDEPGPLLFSCVHCAKRRNPGNALLKTLSRAANQHSSARRVRS